MKKIVIAALAMFAASSAAYASAPQTVSHALGYCDCCDDPNCAECPDC